MVADTELSASSGVGLQVPKGGDGGRVGSAGGGILRLELTKGLTSR